MKNRKNTQCVSAIAQTLVQIDLPRKVYCSLCTDTASYGTDTASYGTDTASCGTDTVSYGTDTASYSSSGKKGLLALCCVLPPPTNFGIFCCDPTRTVLGVLPHALYNHKDPFH